MEPPEPFQFTTWMPQDGKSQHKALNGIEDHKRRREKKERWRKCVEKEGVDALKWCHRDNGKGEVKIERGKGIRGEEAREK